MKDERLEACIARLKAEVSTRLDYTVEYTVEQLRRETAQAIFRMKEAEELTAAEKETAIGRVVYSFRGLDILEPLLQDASVTEIMVNGHQRIFYERDGRMYRYELEFESQDKLESVIQSIVGQVNRTVNESSPIVDARLPDGSRVNVVLPPVSLCGPSLTIRKFAAQPPSLEQLVQLGAIAQEPAEFLMQCVRGRRNMFISGGTGSGKTTMLNALSQYIPEDERIVTIEDAAELQIRTVPNLVTLEARNANTEGKGEIPIRQLIRCSLRMRPSRIIVGEVRGAEALDMLQAMNTGHSGSLSTGHANSVADMLSRLETMALGALHVPVEVIRRQLASALDIMIHLSRMPDYSRKVTEISRVELVAGGEIRVVPLFEYDCGMQRLQPTPESRVIVA